MGCMQSKDVAARKTYEKKLKPKTSKTKMDQTVRGLLEMNIIEAKDIPDMDGLFGGKTDSYVKVKLDGAKIAKTSIIQNSLQPVWNQKFFSLINHIGKELLIEVVDDDLGKNDTVGFAQIDFRDFIAEGGELSGSVQLLLDGEDRGQLEIELLYHPFSKENVLDYGIKVPGCYFPERSGCRVTLFQDAEHWAQPEHEGIMTAAGESYVPLGTWRQVAHAIESATKFIYITGWSVHTEITLVRDDDSEAQTLGELLVEKANNGCAVHMMIWSEYDELIPSLVGTNDNATAEYFQDTKVNVKRCERGSTNESAAENAFARLCYSHHQKSIICDSPPSGDDERLRVVAFVGGLDLTNGRYDTPQHPIFSTLKNRHATDFYQSCATDVRDGVGPRQPWHDIHSYVEGKIAQDVLRNFEERWVKEDDGTCELCEINEDEFNLEDDVYDGEDNWNVQFLRSITSQSCQFSLLDRARKLKTERAEKIEDTIHRAYIHQIRRTQNFVFIENQYFLGSAHVWSDEDKPKKAVNLIAIELVKNIVESIKAGVHHSVYIIIPMYPEGGPETMAVQEILYWQTCTMRMMYASIAQAIEEEGLDTHPTDYLAFFCIGVRGDEIPEDLPEPENDVEITLREKDRFPIYVHSKMMISDDEYIIVGSANINQRSMSGRRDTEMAVGCYQPNFLYQDGQLPAGDVAAFRKSLWVEHMGELQEEFDNPGSLECMRKVKEIAQRNWEKFTADDWDAEDGLQGHLLTYPINVAQDGTVTVVEGYNLFPDSASEEARVLGKKSMYLLEKITT